MKKRRTLIIALLLIAALALGIGYAAFTSTMSINGEVQMGGIASQVNFSKAEVNTTDTTAHAVVTDISGVGTKTLEVNMSGFVHAGHKVVVDIAVTNPHDFDVKLINGNIAQDGRENDDGVKYFTINVIGDVLEAEPVIQNGETLNFQFEVICNATSPVDVTENFTISFDAHAE